jgi:hypothetical protein
MPDFLLTDPGGQRFKLTVPEGVSEQDIGALLAGQDLPGERQTLSRSDILAEGGGRLKEALAPSYLKDTPPTPESDIALADPAGKPRKIGPPSGPSTTAQIAGGLGADVASGLLPEGKVLGVIGGSARAWRPQSTPWMAPYRDALLEAVRSDPRWRGAWDPAKAHALLKEQWPELSTSERDAVADYTKMALDRPESLHAGAARRPRDVTEEPAAGKIANLVQTRQYAGPYGEHHHFDIRSPDGAKLGFVNMTSEMGGQKVYIDNIQAGPGEGGVPHSLGMAAVRGIVADIKRMFPNAKSISGFRVSGARRQAGATGDAEIELAILAALMGGGVLSAGGPMTSLEAGGELQSLR